MTKVVEKNFNWLSKVQVTTKIASSLIICCKKVNPTWTPELDAAIRIIFFAANGGLATRKYNEAYLRKINNSLEQNQLYNSDVINIAAEITENPLFYFNATSETILEQKHIHIVQDFSTNWHKVKLMQA